MIVSSGEKAPKTGIYTCVSCSDAKHVHKGDTVPPCHRKECVGTWRVT